MNDITVLGIFVADISFSGNKIPNTGETILGDSYNIGPGGKGCNQAIAISRLGGKVNFISKLGNDDYGKLAIDKLQKDNIDTSNIIISKSHKTGVAGIHVDRNTGKNAITVVRGAPSSLTIKEIDSSSDAGPILTLKREDNDADGDKLGQLLFQGHNDASTPQTTDYASITTHVVDESEGSEDGKIVFDTITTGSQVTGLEIEGKTLNAISP